MKKSTKKGFTIVELVVVIAIIAILAAVLIPTFAGLIKKANVSKDQQLIRNLNTALLADKAINGDHTTMYAALKAAKDAGYDVAQINANRTDNEILWDSQNDLFCYYNEDSKETYKIEYLPNQELKVTRDKLNDYDYFQIIDAKTADLTSYKYSVYLRSVADSITEVTHNKGVDTGATAVNVKYTTDATQTVIINTNGGKLTIQDKSTGTIYHYGSASTLNIIECHTGSYHENGSVSFAEIAKGRIVLEKGSEVNHIHVNKKSSVEEFDTIIIAKAENVEMPTLSRDDVTIGADGTLVVALQNGTESTDDKDYVWLTRQGIYEQIKVSNSASSAGSTYADQVESTETQTAAQQIANNIGRDGDGNVAATVTVNETEYTVTLDENRNIVVKNASTNEAAAANVAAQATNSAVEAVADKEAVKTGATLFAGGTGTENDPFLIVDYDTFQHVSDLYEEGYYYFKVKDGVTSISLFNNEYVYLNGSLDGNNVVFTHVNGGMFGIVGTCDEHDITPVNLSNFTVSNEGGWGITMNCGAKVLNFINVSVTGYSLHNWNAGEFVRYGTGNVSEGFDFTVNFNQCSCNAEIYSTQNSWSTILVGHTCLGGAQKGTINVDTYTNEHINDSVLYYTGTGTSEGHKYYGMGGVEVFVDGVAKNANENKAVTNIVRVDSTKNPTKAGSGYSITTQADTTKVVVTLLWQYTEWTNNYGEKIAAQSGVGGTIGKTLTFEVTGSTDLKVFDTITNVEIRTGSDKWDYELKDGKLILYMTNTNPYIDGNVTLFVEQFTSGSNIAKYKGSLSLATKTTSSEWVIK